MNDYYKMRIQLLSEYNELLDHQVLQLLSKNNDLQKQLRVVRDNTDWLNDEVKQIIKIVQGSQPPTGQSCLKIAAEELQWLADNDLFGDNKPIICKWSAYEG